MSSNRYDFIVVGAGFAGSIMAMALANSGFRVCLLEKNKHPRFSIGESSTPIADMVLRDLSDQYQLPCLRKISRYGSWQKYVPEITCGLKRGFSYYIHQKGISFAGDENHTRELLVAASENDQNSDTNWLRSDVDYFLVQQALKCGVVYWDQVTINSVVRKPEEKLWSVRIEKEIELNNIETQWIIDATGSENFSGKFLGTKSSSINFHTHSHALYSHFEDVDHWQSYLKKIDSPTGDYPYNPDYSALHHLLEEGWMWMLRFNSGLLSAGLLFDGDQFKNRSENSKEIWKSTLKQYPSLNKIFQEAKISTSPGKLILTGRLQRKLNSAFGDGWAALPHTAGFVDPLHSTGIAQTLAGVEKLLKIFTSTESKKISLELSRYEKQVFRELKFIDLLVSACYKSRNHFRLFTACTMLYFIASITYEQERLSGDIPENFLCADNRNLYSIVKSIHQKIVPGLSDSDREEIIQEIEKCIRPYNKAGLMDPTVKNMYQHTVVVL